MRDRGVMYQPVRGTAKMYHAIKRNWARILKLGIAPAFALYVLFANFILKGPDSTPALVPKNVSCVGWRQTNFCSPFGARIPSLDKDCQTTISAGSGYCECSDKLTVKHVHCGYYTFTCEQECERINPTGNLLRGWTGMFLPAAPLRLPQPVTCPAPGGAPKLRVPHVPEWDAHSNGAVLRQQFSGVWRAINDSMRGALRQYGPRASSHEVFDRDFDREKFEIPESVVQRARVQWQEFMRLAPPYPGPSVFGGRGIVIVGGGLKYTVPAWVNVFMLRKLGCKLPIEMFFPEKEFPTVEMEKALRQRRVTPRMLALPEVQHFQIKSIALALSRFEEVIFLDSDNVPVKDPASLFESAQYKDTGCILWPDFWPRTSSKFLHAILQVSENDTVSGTHESGQMVFDKSRTWPALMLALWLNFEAKLYYNQFNTDGIGVGDKESYAFAMAALRLPYHYIGSSVVAIGIQRQRSAEINGKVYTVDEFLANTMGQHDTKGDMMFFHANMLKWTLAVPAHFKDYNRRWQAWSPFHNAIDAADSPLPPSYKVQFDVERACWEALIELRCMPFLPGYVEVLADRYNVSLLELQRRLDLRDEFHPIAGWHTWRDGDPPPKNGNQLTAADI